MAACCAQGANENAPQASSMRFWRVYRGFILLALVMTIVLIPLGAYVRLSDAGLGCPDWPGCYGEFSPVHAKEQIVAAVAQQGGEHGPVSMAKAWKEMIHRYLASALGLVILVIAAMAWNAKLRTQQSPWFATWLVFAVCLQGAFGAWTVTLLLKPAIVTGHLIGGMTIWAMLLWLACRQFRLAGYAGFQSWTPTTDKRFSGFKHLLPWARVALICVSLQIVLGGWVSTNYAALACTDFPRCQGEWLPAMDMANAFHVFRELGQTAAGEMLPMPALTAIHWAHRVGALIVTAVLLTLWFRARSTPARFATTLMLIALMMQVALGIANVLLHLPLALAVAHNGMAAILLGIMVWMNTRLRRVAA